MRGAKDEFAGLPQQTQSTKAAGIRCAGRSVGGTVKTHAAKQVPLGSLKVELTSGANLLWPDAFA
eukprot:11223762-Lingulodinium_polyedra.AAC.1